MTILFQSILFKPDNIIDFLKEQDKKASYEKDKLIYYPYYFFKYTINGKGLLKLNGFIGCTIDGISGRGAIIDQTPELVEKKTIEGVSLLKNKISFERAKNIAENYLHEWVSLKLKFFAMPKMKLTEHHFMYRPYWIIVNKTNRDEYPSIMIDGVSGKFHPLN